MTINGFFVFQGPVVPFFCISSLISILGLPLSLSLQILLLMRKVYVTYFSSQLTYFLCVLHSKVSLFDHFLAIIRFDIFQIIWKPLSNWKGFKSVDGCTGMIFLYIFYLTMKGHNRVCLLLPINEMFFSRFIVGVNFFTDNMLIYTLN